MYEIELFKTAFENSSKNESSWRHKNIDETSYFFEFSIVPEVPLIQDSNPIIEVEGIAERALTAALCTCPHTVSLKDPRPACLDKEGSPFYA